MSYSVVPNRANPMAVLFVVDQSGSMIDRMPKTGNTKSHQVATVINKMFAELITKAKKQDGVRDYYDVGVIGYGRKGVYNALQGSDSQSGTKTATETNHNAPKEPINFFGQSRDPNVLTAVLGYLGGRAFDAATAVEKQRNREWKSAENDKVYGGFHGDGEHEVPYVSRRETFAVVSPCKGDFVVQYAT